MRYQAVRHNGQTVFFDTREAADHQTALEAYLAYKLCRFHLASIGLVDPDVNKREQEWRKKAYGNVAIARGEVKP